MDLTEDIDFEEDTNIIDKKKEEMKKEFLDENLKKANVSFKKVNKNNKKIFKRKPFLKSGILLIAIAIICLIISSYSPWMYIRYNSENGSVEDVYYRYYDNKNNSNDEYVNNFFKTSNSSKLIGISSDDFTNVPQSSFYIFIIMIVLGALFTIFEIINKFKKFSRQIRTIIHTFFSLGTAIICIYYIFIIVKFLGANIMLSHNLNIIKPSLDILNIVFINPIILMFIVAGILKLSFTMLKINFKEFENIYKSNQPEKTMKNYRYKGEKI